MKTELFNVFTDKQIQVIKDCIRYGLWGDADVYFDEEESEDNYSCEWGYCTDEIVKGKHFKGKEISGICSGIAKAIKENKLNWILYVADYWGDGGSGMIFFHTARLDATKKELMGWAKQ